MKSYNLKISDLEKFPDACELAAVIGMDAFERLLKQFSGLTLYIPMKASIYRAARDREIIQKFKDGANARSLAIEYEVCETWINKIVGDHKAIRP